MKKQLFLAAALAGVFGTTLYSAQEVSTKLENKDGLPYLITFKDNSLGKSALDTNRLFRDVIGLDKDSKMEKIQSSDFFSKFYDEKYQLYYKNLKVEFATYTIHYNNGKLISMNGEIYDTKNIDITPKISETTALAKALKSMKVEKLMDGTDDISKTVYNNPKGELLILPVFLEDKSSRAVLAYKFDVFSEVPFLRSHIYVDANTGVILLDNPLMKHAGEAGKPKGQIVSAENSGNSKMTTLFPTLVAGTAATRYSGIQTIETTLSGNSYILADYTRGNGVFTYNSQRTQNITNTNFTDADNNWTAAEFDNSNYDNAALDAHWGVEKTYDYFKSKFNRNSYDNNGAALKSYVHYRSNYENAQWTGSEMVYGDGANTFKPLTAFDVTAHELGHAVCQSTANLVYNRESGALNEGLSDIWGAAVEYTYAPNKQTFLIGEDITKVSPYYLRSMSNPNSGNPAQPDTYNGTNWQNASSSCYPYLGNDYCGVHYNSGVLNYWFYLLVNGGSGTNDLGNSFNVSGIGMENAAKIVYRLETSYLSSNSNYNNAMTYGIQAAKDLFGTDSAEHKATQNAFYAVGLGSAYSGGTSDTTAPSAPANLTASGTTSSSTNLSWTASTDNVGVTGYYIYNGTTQIGSSASTSYSVTGLSASTTYIFSVKARDAAGNISGSSNTVSVTTSSANTSDTTPPTAPVNLAASGTTATSTNLSWTASTDNVAVTGYNVYSGANLLGSTASTTYTVSGLTPSTTYTFSVKAKDAAGNISGSSNSVSVTTTNSGSQNPPASYCSSSSYSGSIESIGQVKFASINNSSTSTAGYENFTSIVGNVTKGTAYSISITPKFSSLFTFSQGYSVFIDYNRDGDFDDAGETVLSLPSSYTVPATGTVTIPASAATGKTRMRVSMKFLGTPTACETFSYGQVEDYTLDIAAPATIGSLTAETAAIQKTSVYPNPVGDVLNIKSSSREGYFYKIFSSNGQMVSSGKTDNLKIKTSNLISGSYILVLENGEEKITEKFMKK